MEPASKERDQNVESGYPLVVVGIGPGTKDYLVPKALRAVEQADLLVGGPRALELFAYLDKPTRTIDRHLDRLVEFIAVERLQRRVAVLVSGDPGFYSLLPRLTKTLGVDQIEVIPGLSSFQMAFSRLGLPWQEARWQSMHGRPMDDALKLLSHEGWVAFLTDPDHSPEAIAQHLVDHQQGWRRAFVTRDLGYETETVSSAFISDIAQVKSIAYRPALLIVEGGKRAERDGENPENSQDSCNREAPYRKSTTIGLPDEVFQRGQVPMTKSDVRALTLVRAQIEPKDVVWDIGAGTGSISVEAARLAHRGQVYAVERNPEGCELIAANGLAFGLSNLQVIPGMAPDVLDSLPDPDRVIIGGSGGNLTSILDLCWKRLKVGGSIVVNAITVETLSAVVAWLEEKKIPVQATQLQVQRLEKAGAYHLWKSHNPVTILWACKEDV
ncbi:precorrin-6y C5,15-methyltransferase (decarboxylating) subunit CbiE [Heliobacterium chlorum]|uniref:Precorrin-6y C5,15-methyltransferase (Decarboxylating) subunit CbiE n=1 Tax=Heliobacterium chlorum TaxID=2698 RepID=A0ABR7T535_HELCL|nr:precorrin-6y C5,15-methyltransferase (decarboxylating) subunit CbiE [Heliobacterium chlorum]MBC9785776.1 precorrin-6y C5,15-methyltransferase (decarboxylating) subunit CbiE [Heliobacterium chlorum]